MKHALFVSLLALAALHTGTGDARGEELRAPADTAPAGAKAVAKPLLARHLITTANDYMVEVYKNGKRVADEQRELLLERFGATVERIRVDVRSGDWLVFHVVHNRLRWEGSRYFAVAGCVGENEYGFVSDPASGQWSVCDDPARVAAFIRQKDAGTEVRAGAIARPWGEGDGYMKEYAGSAFTGKALWGGASSTWIKFVADGKPSTSVEVTVAPPGCGPKPDANTPEMKSLPVTVVPVPVPKGFKPRKWPVQILSAIYGTGGKDADVTDKVAEHVETHQRMFTVTPPDLGADPNPYWNKSLYIAYMKDGIRREQRRGENEWVLAESFYGPQDAKELDGWLAGTRWLGEEPELQFHADHTFARRGSEERHQWEAAANNKLVLTWADGKKSEAAFDYTWSSFTIEGDAKRVYHSKK